MDEKGENAMPLFFCGVFAERSAVYLESEGGREDREESICPLSPSFLPSLALSIGRQTDLDRDRRYRIA